MNTILLELLINNVVLFILLIIYHFISEFEIKKLKIELRKLQIKNKTKLRFKRV